MLEVALLVGFLAFPDDGVVKEGMGGGSARLQLTPRLSLGPELTFIQGQDHSHTMLTGNVTWDLRRAPSRIVPFVVGGGGVFQTRERFFRESFSSDDPAFTVGGGVRVAAGPRVTVGAEMRLGWELHLRTNGFVGIRLFGT